MASADESSLRGAKPCLTELGRSPKRLNLALLENLHLLKQHFFDFSNKFLLVNASDSEVTCTTKQETTDVSDGRYSAS